MDRQSIDRVLAEMSPDDVADALRFVAVLEACGSMDQADANEWRLRILAWQRFVEDQRPARPN